MRSDPADYELVAPGTLQAVVALLADEPGQWLPIAGGTDLMVQYAAGKLPARKLVSIWNLPELRRIEVLPGRNQDRRGCTYTDLREHDVIAANFLCWRARRSWTGGIANQNRGTLGGNIVNASPAADSLPALLAYDAELILVSVRGERRVPYVGFHTGYKKMKLAPDELIRAVCLRRVFRSIFITRGRWGLAMLKRFRKFASPRWAGCVARWLGVRLVARCWRHRRRSHCARQRGPRFRFV